jgi:hypothetical protein
MSRSALQPTQSITQEVTGAKSLAIKPLGREIDQSSLSIVPRLRISGAIPPLPYIPSWCAQWQFYLSCKNGGGGRYGLSLVTLKMPSPLVLILEYLFK